MMGTNHPDGYTPCLHLPIRPQVLAPALHITAQATRVSRAAGAAAGTVVERLTYSVMRRMSGLLRAGSAARAIWTHTSTRPISSGRATRSAFLRHPKQTYSSF